MIEHKLVEYADVLTQIYGSGTYLQRCLSLSLTHEEQEYLSGLIAGKRSSMMLLDDESRQVDSVRRAKSRLVEKLDTVILSSEPAGNVDYRIQLVKHVFALVTSASLAYRCGALALAKHKLQIVLRQAFLPEFYELRLVALRQLMSIAANEPDRSAYLRYKKELDHSRIVHEQIICLDDYLRRLMLENSRAYKRQVGLSRVAREAHDHLLTFDLIRTPPVIIVAGCSVATSVAQVLQQYDIAERWLRAYPRACTELNLWHDSNKRDWLLQQIIISEFFGKRGKSASYARQLMKLAAAGSIHWFQLSRFLCNRMLRSNNVNLSAQIALDAITHSRFRRQRIDVQRQLLQSAGYAALLSGNEVLYKLYHRRRKSRGLSIIHSAVIDIIRATSTKDILGAMNGCEHALTLLSNEHGSRHAESELRAVISRALRQLRIIEKLASVQERRVKLAELNTRLCSQVIPIASRLL